MILITDFGVTTSNGDQVGLEPQCQRICARRLWIDLLGAQLCWSLWHGCAEPIECQATAPIEAPASPQSWADMSPISH